MSQFRKPFGGAITKFLENDAPQDVRLAVQGAGKDDILSSSYPYFSRMPKKDYKKAYDALQIELAKLQRWVKQTGQRVVVVMEGRDAAGKGGAIARLRANLNPRSARVVALPKPSDAEAGQWYFQRYTEHLPTAGEMVFFDRSWYNRAVVERVFHFSTDAERERFFLQVPDFEEMLVQDGVKLIKIWLTVSRSEQLRRFLAREADPLKQWKLSDIDIASLSHWEDYTDAIMEMFERTHRSAAPWTVIRADDKRRARLTVMRRVLSAVHYDGKDMDVVGVPDPRVCGDPLSMPVRDG
ncbi:MAG: polyphosphate kinase 2 [Paracoccaceae bacterium]|jgi:polyphosphate kinase 2